MEYLFSIESLLTEQERSSAQEAQDRALAATIEFPNVDELGAKLRQWATQGFPDLFIISTYSFAVPKVCSDGVSRSFYDYFQFIMGCTITEQIQKLQDKLNGIRVDCEYIGPSMFNLRVSKVQLYNTDGMSVTEH